MRKVEVKYPIPAQAPQYAELYVNDVCVAEWIYGKDKKYEDPERWADEVIRKRNKVIDRNIARLKDELARWEKEKARINAV